MCYSRCRTMENSMRRLILPVMALLLGAVSANALDAQEFAAELPGLTASDIAALVKTGELTREFGAGEQSGVLAPASGLTEGLLAQIASFPYTTGVELLCYTSRQPDEGADELLRWYNVLRSVSTLKGLTFYSPVYHHQEILFRDSYAVDNPTDDKRIPDPTVGFLSRDSKVTLMQNDATFGANLYELDYRASGDAVAVTMINLDTLSFLFIPVIGARDMQIRILVMPYKDGRIFYGNVVARATTFLGLRDKVQVSALARLQAFYDWFARMATQDRS